MKNLNIYVHSLLFIFMMSGFCIPKETYSVTISFTKLENNKGKVWAALYNSKESYMKKQLQGKSSVISNGKATITFTNLPAGTYAVSAFHDENNNENLDTNALGIPKENYGFSNNPNAMFGPPSFSKASFEVNSQKSLVIELN